MQQYNDRNIITLFKHKFGRRCISSNKHLYLDETDFLDYYKSFCNEHEEYMSLYKNILYLE